MTPPREPAMPDPAPSPTHDGSGTAATVVLAAVVLGGGVLMAAQSRANGTLATVLRDPVTTAIWSIGSGWVLLALSLLVGRSRAAFGRLRAAYRARALPWWMFLGGVVGGALVTTQGYAVPLAGVALVSVCIIAGQALGALVVDHWGIGPGGVRAISRVRVAAALVALLGVLVAIGPRVSASGVQVVPPALASLLVGSLLAVQAATNGRVNVVGREPAVTTFINFSFALVVVLVAGGARLVTQTLGVPAVPGVAQVVAATPWWAWTGGVSGLIYVAINAVAVRRLGVLGIMLLGLTGQLSGALALDLLDPVTRSHVSGQLLAGIALTFAAAIGAGLSALARSLQARSLQGRSTRRPGRRGRIAP